MDFRCSIFVILLTVQDISFSSLRYMILRTPNNLIVYPEYRLVFPHSLAFGLSSSSRRVRGRSAGLFPEQRLEIYRNRPISQQLMNYPRATEKAARMEKHAYSKSQLRVFFFAADWLKQPTCLFGLILATCMRPRYINQSKLRTTNFKPKAIASLFRFSIAIRSRVKKGSQSIGTCNYPIFLSGSFHRPIYFQFEFISNSDPHRNLSDQLQSQAQTDLDMSTFCRHVHARPRRAHVHQNWAISREKYIKIDWSVKMPLRWLIMGVADSQQWAAGKMYNFLLVGRLARSDGSHGHEARTRKDKNISKWCFRNAVCVFVVKII